MMVVVMMMIMKMTVHTLGVGSGEDYVNDISQSCAMEQY